MLFFLDKWIWLNLYLYGQGVAAAVLRGAGKQLFGAVGNLVAFYVIGFPIGVSLMFATNMGIVGKWVSSNYSCITMSCVSCLSTNILLLSHFCTGLWTGLTICVSLRAVVFCIFLCKLDWKKAAEEVSNYITLWRRKSEQTKGPGWKLRPLLHCLQVALSFTASSSKSCTNWTRVQSSLEFYWQSNKPECLVDQTLNFPNLRSSYIELKWI